MKKDHSKTKFFEHCDSGEVESIDGDIIIRLYGEEAPHKECLISLNKNGATEMIKMLQKAVKNNNFSHVLEI